MTPTPQQSAISQYPLNQCSTSIDPLLSYDLFKHEWQQLESNCSHLHRHLMENIKFISRRAAHVKIRLRVRKRSKKGTNIELKKALWKITKNALEFKKRGPWRLPDTPKKYLYDLIDEIIKNYKQIEFFLQNMGTDQLITLHFNAVSSRPNSVTLQPSPATLQRGPTPGRLPKGILQFLFSRIRRSGRRKRGIRL